MAKNVIIYCRVSTDKQSKTGESLQEQEERCRDYCRRNAYQVLGVFAEQYTGTKAKRPKIEQALEFIKNSELKIDHVIVLRIDRVSRGGIAIHDGFKKQFKDLGVTLRDVYGVIGEEKNVVAIEGVDTDKYSWAKSNTNQIAENMTVMMSENERNTILQRLIGQAIKNNQRGYKVRDAEYGYKNSRVMTSVGKKTIQVEKPEESIFIKKMFELKARGDLSDKAIVEELNIMGYRSRVKMKWNAEKTQVIGKIGGNRLSNEQLQRFLSMSVYAGVISEEWTGNKPVKTPYSGLVSIEQWNRANRGKCKINIVSDEEIVIEHYNGEVKLDAPIIQRHKYYNPEYPFGRVLQCPQCGGHLTAERSRSKNGQYHHYYSCRGKKGTKHTNYGLRRDEVNKEIVALFSALSFDQNVSSMFDFISEKVFEKRRRELAVKKERIDKSVKELEIKKSSIIESIQSLINFPDLLESQNEELQNIKLEIGKLQRKQAQDGDGLGLAQFKKYSKKVLEHLDTLVLEWENPELIQLVFDIVYGGKVEFEKLQSRTPVVHEFIALNTKKDFQKNGKSSLNREWSHTNQNYHTIEKYIVNMIEAIDKWKYVIEKMTFD